MADVTLDDVAPGEEIQRDVTRRVRVRVPVRVDLAGGWTDVPPFTTDAGGEVVNFAIAKHVHAVKEMDRQNRISVRYFSDVPSGSGLGTSAALNVALMAVILDDEGERPAAMAERAFAFESWLGNRGGRQDQYGAAYGGFNRLRFRGDEVERLPFAPAPAFRTWLQETLVLAYTGQSRRSGPLHERIWRRYAEGDAAVRRGLGALREAAQAMAAAVEDDRRDAFADTLQHVTATVDGIEPALNDAYRPVANPLMEQGVLRAWKGMGAGGGGYAALLPAAEARDTLIEACEEAGWRVEDWTYDDNGLTRAVETFA